ncbi:MAG: 3-hydroxyacyl-CoA dehydrogenase family protein [Gammaproteobacteria bacterium]|nr:3-hydroxyacyl-CoA dehydrogenase family protein [Gammaproteobacteria bacterium]
MAPVSLQRAIPGLIGNRLQHALKREAIALVADGVCDATTIDDVVKLGFGARMAVLGPMEQSDLVGLDLTLAIHESLMPTLDRTEDAHPYLIDKVHRGELGMDSGVGFRTWTPSSAKAVRDRLDRWNIRASQGDNEES